VKRSTEPVIPVEIRPWSLRPLATAAGVVIAGGFGVTSGVMVWIAVKAVDAPLPIRILIAGLGVSAAIGAVSSVMIGRYAHARSMGPSFVRSTWRTLPPEDLDFQETRLWWWIRTFNICWLVGGTMIAGIAFVIWTTRG
jgi:hypothetical protein